MKLEEQVCSLNLAKKLKELGVRQETFLSWQYFPHTDSYALQTIPVGSGLNIAAFTVAELGEMLPVWFSSWQDEPSKWQCEQSDAHTVFGHIEEATTEADARAKMLIYLIENKLITL